MWDSFYDNRTHVGVDIYIKSNQTKYNPSENVLNQSLKHNSTTFMIQKSKIWNKRKQTKFDQV